MRDAESWDREQVSPSSVTQKHSKKVQSGERLPSSTSLLQPPIIEMYGKKWHVFGTLPEAYVARGK
jgi:hypothetical protein